MVAFAALHIILTIAFLSKLIPWLGSKEYKSLAGDPLKNAALLAPFISITMSMNVFIGPIRYFVPFFQENFQAMMAPALIGWSAIFVALMVVEVLLLGVSFRKGFDIDRIHFGWLLHPFALGMVSVVGSGIAAMAKAPGIANTAAFLTLISATMGLFLLVVKMIVLFKSHFKATGLPAKQFLPSFLIVIPNITLFAITAFRLGHYLHNQHGVHMGPYYFLVVGLSFAFEIWYMLFGLTLLVDYFRNHHFREFYVTQWGFICPLVAFAVLGSFAYKIVLMSPVIYGLILVTMAVTVLFYLELLQKHWRCTSNAAKGIACDA